MSRAFYISGTVFLFCALVLSFLSSISLPYLPALDFVRVNFGSSISSGSATLSEVRWGIWGPCIYNGNGDRTCVHTGHGYEFLLETREGQKEIIGASWTRGLAIHPVATGFVAIAFGFAVSKYEHGPLVASLTSFLAAVVLLIAFAIDIALYADVHHQVGKLNDVQGNVNAGSAFWMTMVSIILVLLAGCSVCFGRRKESGGNAYPMMTKTSSGGFLSRFRRN
ncbi:pali-domain-containing protein [Mycena galericulata]|nr:pali-domain-containing protein [Mycena galericulata]KAJ7509123.1 pali-domain-containing protein [Mycena galericulata]